jgi:hypothetical protein
MILWGAIDDLFTLFSDQKDKQIKKKRRDRWTNRSYILDVEQDLSHHSTN